VGKRRPASSQGKLRTREHIIADLAVNHVERQVLLAGFTLERTAFDYGLDGILRVFNSQGEQEEGIVYFQIKGTDQITWIQEGAAISFRVERRDLQHWLVEPMPVMLAVYDHTQGVVYFLYIQRYFETLPDFNLFQAGQTITVHIPGTQILNVQTVNEIAGYLRQVIQQITGNVRHE
jgi:hypothetical protein